LSQHQDVSTAGRIKPNEESQWPPLGIEPVTFRLLAQYLNRLLISLKNIDALKIITYQVLEITFLFRKHSPYNKHLNVDGTSLVEHGDVAEAFEKYFQSVYNNHFGEGYFSGYLSSNFVHLPPISDLNILKTVKGLRLSKSVRLCGTPGFLYRSFPKY
jgi:hypothetical protein